jgi:invasion protein IalB
MRAEFAQAAMSTENPSVMKLPSTTVLALGGLGLFLLGAVLAAFGTYLLVAGHDFRNKVPTSAFIQDWRLDCPGEKDTKGGCIVQQTVVQKSTNSAVAQLRIVHGAAADTLVITVPFGVLIPPGLSIAAGTDPAVAVPYKTCDQLGCIAFEVLSPTQRTQLEQNTTGTITIVGADGKAIPLSFSLRGFSDAMHEYDADWRRRSGHWL